MKSVNEDQFTKEVLESSEPILVDFYATWCAPCRSMLGLLSSMTDEYNIVKVDIEECPNLASIYKVSSVPTFVLFKDGDPVKTLNGVQSKSAIADMFN